MNVIVTLVIVLYLVVTFGVAYGLKKRVKNNEDYLLAGRKIGPVLTATMLLAINFGGAFVLGTSQDAYSVGFAAISFAVGICVGLVLLAIFVAPKVRRGSFVTVPEFLGVRFSSASVSVLASVMSVLALTGILAGQVGAAGSALTSLGLTRNWAVVVGAVLIVLFTVLSGMWGVAVTDFVQFWVIAIGLLLVMFIAVDVAGGFGKIGQTFIDQGTTQPFNPLNQGWSFFLGAALPVVVHKLVGQDVMQRVFAAKSVKAASIGAGLAGLLTALFAVVPAIAGMAARVIFPDLDPSVGVVPALINDVLPVWAAGILIAALISAVLSTADALLLAAVSNISKDLLGRTRWWKAMPPLQTSRLLTVILGALGLVFTLMVPNIITVLTMAFTMYGSGVFVSFMLGLFSRFGGRWSALGSIIVGAVFGLLGILGLLAIPHVPTIVLGVGASLVAYVAIAYLASETRMSRVVENVSDPALEGTRAK